MGVSPDLRRVVIYDSGRPSATRKFRQAGSGLACLPSLELENWHFRTSGGRTSEMTQNCNLAVMRLLQTDGFLKSMKTCRHFRHRIPGEEANELRAADSEPCSVCDPLASRVESVHVEWNPRERHVVRRRSRNHFRGVRHILLQFARISRSPILAAR